MDDPIITIVVPVYKVPEELLHKCLKSIEAQTSKHFEAILIDDGSPDNGGRICDEYAERNDNFRVIHQKNGGLSVVRNVGIDNARAQWVCFVDGDDWIEPNTVEFTENYARKHPQADVLIWDEYYDIDAESIKNQFFGRKIDGVLELRAEKVKRLIDLILPEKGVNSSSTNLIDIGTANARAYNVAFLRRNNLYNKPGLKRMQDNLFNLWVFDKAEYICYTEENLYHYTYNESAATKKYTPDIADTMQLLYESIIEFVEASGKEEFYRGRVYLRFIRIIARIFELNYANQYNNKLLSERLKEAKADMDRPCYREIITKCDTGDQGFKIKLIHSLLKRKMYLALFALTKINTMTRKKRLATRKTKTEGKNG